MREPALSRQHVILCHGDFGRRVDYRFDKTTTKLHNYMELHKILQPPSWGWGDVTKSCILVSALVVSGNAVGAN